MNHSQANKNIFNPNAIKLHISSLFIEGSKSGLSTTNKSFFPINKPSKKSNHEKHFTDWIIYVYFIC